MQRKNKPINILGIETSCDETAADVSPAVIGLVAFFAYIFHCEQCKSHKGINLTKKTQLISIITPTPVLKETFPCRPG